MASKPPLNAASETHLAKVLPQLVAVVREAHSNTTQPFEVLCGVRTLAEQKDAFKRRVTRTMHSKHLIQADGFSHAVDVVPLVNNQVSFDWELIYPIVVVMDAAARKLGFAHQIRWGGAWDRVLSDFHGDAAAYKTECQNYVKRTGKHFLDGPHFEWVI